MLSSPSSLPFLHIHRKEEEEAYETAAEEEEEEEEEEETPFLSSSSSSSFPSSSSLSPHEEAIRRAQVEMAVEDYNGLLRLEGGGVFGEKPGEEGKGRDGGREGDYNGLLRLEGGGVFGEKPGEGGKEEHHVTYTHPPCCLSSPPSLPPSLPPSGHFIVMPMTELFDPPLGSVLHDKLQYSDKVRPYLPPSLLSSPTPSYPPRRARHSDTHMSLLLTFPPKLTCHPTPPSLPPSLPPSPRSCCPSPSSMRS